MPKKLLFVIALVAFSSFAGGAQCLSAGVEVTWTPFNDMVIGLKIPLRCSLTDLQLTAGVEYGGGASRVGMALDWWVLSHDIGSAPFSYYLGGGFHVTSVYPDWCFGVRVPIGVQWWPFTPRFLEVFAEYAPSMMVVLGTSGTAEFPLFIHQGGIGLRFWIPRK